jgi:uncharacterized membrane protein
MYIILNLILNLENIIYNNKGFLFTNTLVYSILVIFFYFLFYKFLKKQIKIDLHLVKTIICFLFFSAFFRILAQDFTSLHLINYSSNFYNIGFYLKTPWFLIFICIIYILLLLSSILLKNILNKKFNKNIKYYNLLNYLFTPLFILLIIFIIIYSNNLLYLILPLFLSLLLFYIFLFLFRFLNFKILQTKINKLTFFSQLLDSIVTIFALHVFPNILVEKHFISRYICNINLFLFLFLKILFVVIFIYLVDKYIEDRELNIYFKLLIIILGFLISFRNLLTLAFLII